MNTSTRKYIGRFLCVATLLLSVAAARAIEPNVLAVGSVSESAGFEVLEISTNGTRKLAEMKGQVWYGSDKDSAAFLQVDGPKGRGVRILVLDLKTMKPVVDKVFTNAHAWPLKIPMGGPLAVRSKDSTIYFNGYEPWTNGFPCFCYEKVNWKTGEAHPVNPMPTNSINGAAVLALPKGFAGVGYGRGIAIYDETTRRELPMPKTDSWADREVYYVPMMGLMEYFQGVSRQLTDAALQTITNSGLVFSNSAISSGISVRMINEKPRLIWGEGDESNQTQFLRSKSSEIVIYDPVKKKEVLRKSLESKYSYIMPDWTGQRIYLVKPDSKEIDYLDRKTGTVNFFANVDLPKLNKWLFAVVAAN